MPNFRLVLNGSGTAPLRAGGETGADGTFAFEIQRLELPARCYYENGRDLGAGPAWPSPPACQWGGRPRRGPPGTKPRSASRPRPVRGNHRESGGPAGRPGITVRVVGLYFPKGGDLAAFADDVKEGKLDQSLIYQHLGEFEGDDLRDGALNPVFPPVRTAKDGTFTLNGLGRERATLLGAGRRDRDRGQ